MSIKKKKEKVWQDIHRSVNSDNPWRVLEGGDEKEEKEEN